MVKEDGETGKQDDEMVVHFGQVDLELIADACEKQNKRNIMMDRLGRALERPQPPRKVAFRNQVD